jgi:hypothetical protein
VTDVVSAWGRHVVAACRRVTRHGYELGKVTARLGAAARGAAARQEPTAATRAASRPTSSYQTSSLRMCSSGCSPPFRLAATAARASWSTARSRKSGGRRRARARRARSSNAPPGVRRADEPRPGRHAPAGDDARRAQAEAGARHRRAESRDRRSQDPARAVGSPLGLSEGSTTISQPELLGL